MPNPVLIPLLNPNEPEALLASLYISEGQQVSEGDLLCTLETTKSTADVPAEAAGFVLGIQAAEGQTLQAGAVLCYLADSPDEALPEGSAPTTAESESAVPEGLRITQPALELARAQGVDLAQFPVGPLITEGAVRSKIEKAATAEPAIPESEFDSTAILIYGGGGHGKACLDLLRALGTYRVVGFVDDGIPAGEAIMGVPVLGGSEVLSDLYPQGVRLAVNAVGGIGNVAIRVKVFGNLSKAGFGCPAVVHPTAYVEPSARLAAGVQVFPQAYVGSEARVGFGTIVNTGAIVSHDCDLGKYVNISPGAILAGGVKVGARALVGMGATVNLLARVGVGARIGNGATVKSDVPENGIVRAGGIWPPAKKQV